MKHLLFYRKQWQGLLQWADHNEQNYIGNGLNVIQTRTKLLPAAADEGDVWCSRRRMLSDWAVPSWWRRAPGCITASLPRDCSRPDDPGPVWSPKGNWDAGETGAQVESALTKADDGSLSWSANLAFWWGSESCRCLTTKYDSNTCNVTILLHCCYMYDRPNYYGTQA